METWERQETATTAPPFKTSLEEWKLNMNTFIVIANPAFKTSLEEWKPKSESSP